MFLRLLSTLALLACVAADYQHQYCKNNGTLDCDCDFGWTGGICNTPEDFCHETKIIRKGEVVVVDVCGEFGDCTNQADGAECTCHPGWEGPYCQHNVDYCKQDSCHSGATCVDLLEPGFHCVCPKWRTGPTCSEYDICNNLNVFHQEKQFINIKPCGEHGNCTTLESGIHCDCDEGYHGNFCEIRNETSCQHNNQMHSHGAVWRERCNTCQCHFGKVECEISHWCPARCLVYPPQNGHSDMGIRVGCETFRENCIPDKVECARENDLCDFPSGWCFPIGIVALATPTPNTLPTL